MAVPIPATMGIRTLPKSGTCIPISEVAMKLAIVPTATSGATYLR